MILRPDSVDWLFRENSNHKTEIQQGSTLSGVESKWWEKWGNGISLFIKGTFESNLILEKSILARNQVIGTIV